MLMKLLSDLSSNRALRTAFMDDPASVIASYDLSDEARGAVGRGSDPTLRRDLLLRELALVESKLARAEAAHIHWPGVGVAEFTEISPQTVTRGTVHTFTCRLEWSGHLDDGNRDDVVVTFTGRDASVSAVGRIVGVNQADGTSGVAEVAVDARLPAQGVYDVALWLNYRDRDDDHEHKTLTHAVQAI